MKFTIFLGALFSTLANGGEIRGEWSICDSAKNGYAHYTTIFTKNFRYEIVLFGKGKGCKNLDKNTFAAAYTVSTISDVNKTTVHERIKNAFITFDEERRSLIGNAKSCKFSEWKNTLDPSCEIEGALTPDFNEALDGDVNRPNGKEVVVYVKDKKLHEDVYKDFSLQPTNIYNRKMFH